MRAVLDACVGWDVRMISREALGVAEGRSLFIR